MNAEKHENVVRNDKKPPAIEQKWSDKNDENDYIKNETDLKSKKRDYSKI